MIKKKNSYHFTKKLDILTKKLFWWDCLILSNSRSVISQVLIFYSSFLILYNKNIFPIIFLNLSNFLQ